MWVLTVGLVAIEGFDGEQEVLVLQVLDLREDGLQLQARGWDAGTGSRGGLPACSPPCPSTSLAHPQPFLTVGSCRDDHCTLRKLMLSLLWLSFSKLFLNSAEGWGDTAQPPSAL